MARQHEGNDDPTNLALACHRCNLKKGPNLTGIDPVTKQLARLFHPREDTWSEHFEIKEFTINGTTPVGRATVQLLRMNDSRRIELREQISGDAN